QHQRGEEGALHAVGRRHDLLSPVHDQPLLNGGRERLGGLLSASQGGWSTFRIRSSRHARTQPDGRYRRGIPDSRFQMPDSRTRIPKPSSPGFWDFSISDPVVRETSSFAMRNSRTRIPKPSSPGFWDFSISDLPFRETSSFGIWNREFGISIRPPKDARGTKEFRDRSLSPRGQNQLFLRPRGD